MEIARSSMTLPEHFLEEIVARMPYSRSIFKFRCLSKGWLARLSPVGSLRDDGDKQLATSFQTLQMLGRFNSWDPSFALIVFTSDKNCWAYDCRSFTNRVALPSLSFISKELRFEKLMYADGPLVVLPLRAPQKTSEKVYEELGEELGEQGVGKQEVAELITENTSVLYVTNICTGSWKKLPARPNVGDTFCKSVKLVCDTTSGTYKVICLVEEAINGTFSIQVYDSKTETWRRKELSPYPPRPWTFNLEYLNGVVYTLAFYFQELVNSACLLAFNLEEWKIDRLRLQYTDKLEDTILGETNIIHMVVCNARLMLILCNTGDFEAGINEKLRVLEIDPISLGMVKLSTYSWNNAAAWLFVRASRDQIFIGNPDRPMLAYNVGTNEWIPAGEISLRRKRRRFRDDRLLCGGCFQPGLNPFMAV